MKYLVLHYSHNWIDGLAIKCFDTREDAEKYIRNFQTDSSAHKSDKIKLVEVINEFQAEELDHGLYGFASRKPKEDPTNPK